MSGIVLGAERVLGANAGILAAEWDMSAPSTRLTRLEAAADFTFRPSINLDVEGYSDFDYSYPHSECRLCTVDNGNVVAYQGEPMFTRTPPAPLDVCLAIPPFYWRLVVDGGRWRPEILTMRPNFGFANKPDGYFISPMHEPNPAAPNGYEMAYLGIYKSDTNFRSVSGGLARVSTTMEAFRNGHSARGSNIWSLDLAAHRTWLILSLVMIADMDFQAAVGSGHVAGSGLIAKGGADNVPWHTGRTGNYVKILHVEQPYGEAWEICDGTLIQNGIVHINPNPATWANAISANYRPTTPPVANIAFTSGGYYRALGHDPTAPHVMTPQGPAGAEGTFVSDGGWFNNSGLFMLLLGGAWSSGGFCGAFAWGSASGVADVIAILGSRVQHKKPFQQISA